VEDSAQDVAKDVTQGVVEEVLGAAEDGSTKVLIVARVIFQRRNPRPTHACRPPRCPWATREGRAREGRGAGREAGRCRGCSLPAARSSAVMAFWRSVRSAPQLVRGTVLDVLVEATAAVAVPAAGAEVDVDAPGKLRVDVLLGDHAEDHRMDGGGERPVAQLEVGCGGREARDLSAVPVFDEVDPGPKLHGECREGCLALPHRSSDGLAVTDGAWGPATEEDEAVVGLVDERFGGWGFVELRDRRVPPPPSWGGGGGEGAAPRLHDA